MTVLLFAPRATGNQSWPQKIMNWLSSWTLDSMPDSTAAKVVLIVGVILAAILLIDILFWLFGFITGRKKRAFTVILTFITFIAIGLFIEKQLYVRGKVKGGYVTKVSAGDVLVAKFADELDLEKLKIGDSIAFQMSEESQFVSANDAILPGGSLILARAAGKRQNSGRVIARIEFRSVKTPGRKPEPLKGFITMSGASESELIKMRQESRGSLGLVVAWAASSNPIFILGGFTFAVIGSDLIQRLTDPPISYLRWSSQDGNRIKKGSLVGIRLYSDLYIHQ